MKKGDRWTSVQGLDLVASLLTAGAKTNDGDPLSIVVGDLDSKVWNFEKVTSGGEPVSKLRHLWTRAHEKLGEDWTQSPEMQAKMALVPDEVVFAIATWALDNRMWAEQVERRRRGAIAVKPGDRSILILGPNIPKRKEEILLRASGV